MWNVTATCRQAAEHLNQQRYQVHAFLYDACKMLPMQFWIWLLMMVSSV
jgi:hypothetical protein